MRILGTRGVPANHGGFETAVQHIGTELVQRGWRVVVYCQHNGPAEISEDVWHGIERVHVSVPGDGPVSTVRFDATAARHAARYSDLCLTFGYNTAFLLGMLRAHGIRNVVNMDGVEWRRARWSPWQRRYLRVNEYLGTRLADHLIADHPVIHQHLRQRAPRARISTVTYGSPAVVSADAGQLTEYGVEPGRYLTVIARPVRENSILEIVSGFSRRPRGMKLLVLGDYSLGTYARAVKATASDEVLFPGSIYDADTVAALRFHSVAYAHGHTVGGTNPSLVEALGCGNPVLAHDNPFNRWTADRAGLYFADEDGFERVLEQLLEDPALGRSMAEAARERHAANFAWSRITDGYEEILHSYLPQRTPVRLRRRTAGSRIPTPRRPVVIEQPTPAVPDVPVLDVVVPAQRVSQAPLWDELATPAAEPLTTTAEDPLPS